ncbi:bifunctional protein FolD [Streptomyces xanthochromogenes]
MSARIIDGKALSTQVRGEVAQRARQLAANGVTPGLAVVLVGEDPASQIYVRNKAAACEAAGMFSRVIPLGADTPEDELLDVIESLNDTAIHGILSSCRCPGTSTPAW